jgi:hypothetical protein
MTRDLRQMKAKIKSYNFHEEKKFIFSAICAMAPRYGAGVKKKKPYIFKFKAEKV